MKVTYYGHSSFGVEIAGKHLLFDPYITPNALATLIKVSEIKVDYLLLSYAHMDHIADVPFIAENTEAMVVSNFELYEHFSKQGIAKIRPVNPGGAFTTKEGITIKAVTAVHSSSFNDGSYGGVAMGYVISSKEGSFYFAGDTALTYDMKLIGESTSLSFALLPIGDNFTMGADDAIKACEFIKCTNIIGMHYDTFDIIKIDHNVAKAKFEKAGKKLTLFNIGETKEF
jgi:L-ascorbate metabolism protein UlaG (beta-lactamase superfamily)